ncbi:DUF2637 domain-containing protein [Sphaerisporangium sp. NPDC051017]|uniref:DUF2637 domain-containing protein n=1 Tax=Sphaerisporangium sp. NPDC051017 TaxID=3154636 RepID=UPI00342D7D0D
MIRWSTTVVVVALAAIAAAVSYEHLSAVIASKGLATGVTASLVPAIPDLLVYAASMCTLDATRRGVRPNWLVWVGLVVGIGSTLAGNVLHGIERGIVGAAFSALPAVALVLAFEMLMILVRSGTAAQSSKMVADLPPLNQLSAIPCDTESDKTARDPEQSAPEMSSSPMGEEDHEVRVPGVPDDVPAVPEPVPERRSLLAGLPVLGPIEGFPRAALAASDGGRRVQVSVRVPGVPVQVGAVPGAGKPDDEDAVPDPQVRAGAGVPEASEVQVQGAQHFAAYLTAGRVPTVKEIKDGLRVGTDKAREVREHLVYLVDSGTRP